MGIFQVELKFQKLKKSETINSTVIKAIYLYAKATCYVMQVKKGQPGHSTLEFPPWNMNSKQRVGVSFLGERSGTVPTLAGDLRCQGDGSGLLCFLKTCPVVMSTQEKPAVQRSCTTGARM